MCNDLFYMLKKTPPFICLTIFPLLLYTHYIHFFVVVEKPQEIFFNFTIKTAML